MPPRLKWLVITLAVVVALVWASALALRQYTTGDLRVARYATRTDAEADGAFRRGALPDFLPASARALLAVHDAASSARWLRFEADSTELAALTVDLAPVTPDDARRSLRPPPRHAGNDWPPELTGAEVATGREARRLGLFRADIDGWCLAVEWRSGRTWGWSCKAPG